MKKDKLEVNPSRLFIERVYLKQLLNQPLDEEEVMFMQILERDDKATHDRLLDIKREFKKMELVESKRIWAKTIDKVKINSKKELYNFLTNIIISLLVASAVIVALVI